MPAILINQLTDKECRSAQPNGDKPAMLLDGQGLYLQVTPSKRPGNPPARSWVFLYRNVEGKKTLLGLGSLHDTSLAEARELAKKQRDLLDSGKDPKAEKARVKAAIVSDYKAQKEADNAKKAAMTFKEGAAIFMQEKLAQNKWSNKANIYEWKASLDIIPSKMLCKISEAFGSLPIAEIDQDDVLNLLKPMWFERPNSAARFRNRIEVVLNYWAANNKIPNYANPAAWERIKECGLISPEEIKGQPVPHASLPHSKVTSLLKKVRVDPRIAARALEIMILIPMRRNAVVNAKWGEFDLTGEKTEEGFPTWTIPKERMKGKNVQRKAHRVPLSTTVLALLNSIKTENAGPDDWVFPYYKGSWTKAKCIDSDAPYKLLKSIDPTITLHGFRSTFRCWCDEPLNPNAETIEESRPRVEYEVAETCLAHVLGTKVVRAYARGDMLRLRKPVMEAWAKYCDGAIGQLRPVDGSHLRIVA
jgi:integrase